MRSKLLNYRIGMKIDKEKSKRPLIAVINIDDIMTERSISDKEIKVRFRI